MRTSLFGALALLAALAPPVGAQVAQTVLYDANGRMIGHTSAYSTSAVVSPYVLDDADNRTSRGGYVVSMPPVANRLYPPYTLAPTQKLTSLNGLYTLTFEPSGDLVLNGPSGVVWNSCTGQGRGLFVRVVSNGQLAIYDAPGQQQIWATPTAGNPGAELTLENSGVAVLRSSGGATLWSSTTPCA